MFPLTKTVETRGKNINLIVPTYVENVVLLSRKDTKNLVEIGVGAEDYYRIKE